MNYITFNEMIEVNGLLEEKGLNFKVHGNIDVESVKKSFLDYFHFI